MRHVRRNKERLPFLYDVIDDPITFADANFDVALQLVKIFFRIHQVKIVARVRAFDDHDEEIASVIEILIAHRWLELFAVVFDPMSQVNWRLDGWSGVARRAEEPTGLRARF